MPRPLILLVLLLCPLAAQAGLQPCATSIGGEVQELAFDPEEDALRDNRSLRERVFGGWGKIDCPAYITLRHLTPSLSDEERTPFCLQYDKDARTFTGYSQGERDAYQICKDPSKSVCNRVNQSKDAAAELSALAAREAAERAGSVVTHSSGAAILSGSGSSIAGTLGSLGTSALAVLTAPAALTAATVSLVAIGGAVYVCGE